MFEDWLNDALQFRHSEAIPLLALSHLIGARLTLIMRVRIPDILVYIKIYVYIYTDRERCIVYICR